jgi:hypothetical protein
MVTRTPAALTLVGVGLGLLVVDRLGTGGWPLLVLLPGLALLGPALAGDRASSALAIPGAVASATGAVLLYQATAGHWSSWAYAWALAGPAATGLGLVVHGRAAGQRGLVAVGARLAAAGLAAFAVLGLFFEAPWDRSGSGASQAVQTVGPLLLIAAGLLVYVWRRSPEAPGNQG